MYVCVRGGDVILTGDATDRLRELANGSVQCCITSPPYYGLRDYRALGQIGLEATPEFYVARLVEVFREVRRVLRADGTLWLNLGDGFANKQLLGMPWRVAFALQQRGWYLRSDIIWSKPNPMPESVTDRPTSAHEHVFLFAKSRSYFYDADAIREPHTDSNESRHTATVRHGTTTSKDTVPGSILPESPYLKQTMHRGLPGVGTTFGGWRSSGRNKRNVWEIATQPYPDAHFATFPTKLVEPCVLAGSHTGDTILDPFCGSGTVGVVAHWHGRDFIGVDLNPVYVQMAERRISSDGALGRVARRSVEQDESQMTLEPWGKTAPDLG